MNLYYINEQCEKLDKLSTELYESLFDEFGNLPPHRDYIDTGVVLERIKRLCEDMLEDIKVD